MFIDILVFLAVAKVLVLLAEDAAYAVRGKKSPRRKEQARRREQDATGGPPPPTTGMGRSKAAVGGYLAGLVEDATENARANKRRRDARRRGASAVDGVVVDLDAAGRWYADCDLCDWSSRPYRLEPNARGAGREHTRTEHPEVLDGKRDKDAESGPDGKRDADDGAVPPAIDADDDGEAPPRRWKPRVIPGGNQDPAEPGSRSGQRDEPQSVVHDDCTYCTGCPKCRPPAHGWRCTCGARGEGFASEAEAKADAAKHTCQAAAPPAEPKSPVDERPSRGQEPIEEVEDEDWDKARRDNQEMYRRAYEEAGRCRYPMPEKQYGMCGDPVVKEEHHGGWEDNPHCGYHTALTEAQKKPFFWQCQGCGQRGQRFGTQAEAEADAANHTPCPAVNKTNPAPSATDTKEHTVNLEATGPEEIRTAFTAATQTAQQHAEEMAGIAGTLTEAADRYESLQMVGSTVGHIREAADAFANAQNALNTAAEELEAALADFNAHDGAVADTVADTGGNVADREVLVS
jgi:uncharacterized protein YukE